ncbi:MAG: hypothetical protein R3B89_16305 [Polyangiaceae bacterium]
MIRASLALGVLGLLSACSGSDGGSSQTRGTAQKGEACEEDLDCAEELAQCHPQGVCTGALTSEALETECSEGNADICAGFACLVLNANAQGKTGLCTYKCESNADCGQGVCVELSGAGKVCLSPCQDSSDCSNGFVCVADPGGSGSACLVEPAAG